MGTRRHRRLTDPRGEVNTMKITIRKVEALRLTCMPCGGGCQAP